MGQKGMLIEPAVETLLEDGTAAVRVSCWVGAGFCARRGKHDGEGSLLLSLKGGCTLVADRAARGLSVSPAGAVDGATQVEPVTGTGAGCCRG